MISISHFHTDFILNMSLSYFNVRESILMQLTQPANNSKNVSDHQVEGRSWIYVQHVNLAFFGG